VARRLAGDEKACGVRTAIEDLMLLARRHLDPCAGLQDEAVLLHFDSQLSLKDVEKLSGSEVKMPNLTRAGWHQLFDDAEIGCPDEVPAVAAFSPLVVLSGLRADDLSHRRIAPVAAD
jgi:hypothetical protein